MCGSNHPCTHETRLCAPVSKSDLLEAGFTDGMLQVFGYALELMFSPHITKRQLKAKSGIQCFMNAVTFDHNPSLYFPPITAHHKARFRASSKFPQQKLIHLMALAAYIHAKQMIQAKYGVTHAVFGFRLNGGNQIVDMAKRTLEISGTDSESVQLASLLNKMLGFSWKEYLITFLIKEMKRTEHVRYRTRGPCYRSLLLVY